MEVHSGYLTVKINSGLLKSKSYTNHWCILFSGRGTWLSRVDIYPTKEDAANPASCKKSLFLDQVKWTAVDSVTPAFALDIKGRNCTFKMTSEREWREWVEAMCCVSPELRESKTHDTPEGDFVVEDNVLYDSSHQGQTFAVRADTENSSDCPHLTLQGSYKLVIGPASILVTSPHTDAKVAEWPLRFLRTYGHSKHSFFVHTGSKCETGAGEFSFFTTEGEKIVALLSSLANHLNEVKDTTVSAAQQGAEGRYNRSPNSSGVQHNKEGGHIRSLSSGSNKPVPPAKPKYPGSSSPPPTSPKPILVTAHMAPGDTTPAVTNNFKSELIKTISQVSSEVSRRGSNGSISSDSSSKTTSVSGDKRAQRILEKEEKKKKKEEKKKQKEAEKMKKKEEKLLKEKAKAGQGKSQPDVNTGNIYASPYNDVNSDPAIPVHYAVNQVETGPVYSDPWENRPLPSPAGSGPTMTLVHNHPEAVYAQAVRTSTGSSKPHPDQEYEDLRDYSVPPELPPKMFEEPEEAGVYEHLHQLQEVTTPTHENIYGMASAKALVRTADTFYEDTRPSPGYRPVLQSSTEDSMYETVN